VGCHAELGCLSGVDCDVACEWDLGDVVSCIGEYDPCTSDADCDGGRCVEDVGASSGACDHGLSGASCVDDGDCVTGHCVAVALDGRRACSTGDSNEYCNDTDHCGASLTCVLPPASFVGRCGAGELGDPCTRAADCELEICVPPGSPATELGTCGDGAEGASCSDGSECQSGLCSKSEASSQGVCSNGDLDSVCYDDDQCD